MSPFSRNLFPVLWLAWAAYWLIASRHVKAVVRSEPPLSRLLHIIPLATATLLLALPVMPIAFLNEKILFPRATWPFWAGAALTAAGLAFTIWARLNIGKNWSAIVTIKQDHELITSGPYRIVRHPIYTGLLLGFAGSALARCSWAGVLALAIACAALWRKLRLEERGLRGHFGDRYAAYSRRVAALIPGVL